MDHSTRHRGLISHQGGQFLAVWAAAPHGEGLRSARITPQGALLDPGGVLLITGEAWHSDVPSLDSGAPALASGGNNALLVWGSGGKVRGARIDAQGDLLDPDGVDLAATLVYEPGLPHDQEVSPPEVAFDGASYLVAWQTADNGERALHSLRVSPEALPLGPASTLTIPGAVAPKEINTVGLLVDGTGALLAWNRQWSQSTPLEEGGELNLFRLGSLGEFLDPAPIHVASQARNVAIAPGDVGAFMVWSAWFDSNASVDDASLVGARFALDGTQLDTPPTLISGAANTQTEPSIAFDGQNYLVAWQDNRSYEAGGHWDVQAARVNPAGEILDMTGIPLATGPLEELSPQVISGGEGALALWFERNPDKAPLSSHGALRMARVDAAGTLLDDPPVDLGDSRFIASAASAGGDVWLFLGSPTGMLLRVGAGGELGETVALPGIYKGALASDGTSPLLVWVDKTGWGYGQEAGGLRASHVGPDGALLDPDGIVLVHLEEKVCSVQLAFGGGVYLMVWKAFDPNARVIRLRAARVTPAGAVLDPEGLVLTEEPEPGLKNGLDRCYYTPARSSPTVAFDGRMFVTAWFSRETPPADWPIRLHGATMTPQGILSTPFEISGAPVLGPRVELASRGEGETLVAFSRLVDEDPYASMRARLVRITTCGDCPSELCVDGVCCDTLCGGGDATDCMACSVAAGAPADGVCAPVDSEACRPDADPSPEADPNDPDEPIVIRCACRAGGAAEAPPAPLLLLGLLGLATQRRRRARAARGGSPRTAQG